LDEIRKQNDAILEEEDDHWSRVRKVVEAGITLRMDAYKGMLDESRKIQAEASGELKKELEQSNGETEAVLNAKKVLFEESQRAISEAMSQVEKDIETLSRVNSQDESLKLSVDDDQVIEAMERLEGFAGEFGERQEEMQRAQQKAASEAAKAVKEAEAEKRKAALETQRAEREAEQERKEAVRAQQAAERERARLAEESKRVAGEVAKAWVHTYEQHATAARAANQIAEQGNRQIVASSKRAADGLTKLGRGAVLLGFANGDASEEALKKLAKVQAAIDIVKGGYSVLSGLSGVFEGLKKAVTGNAAATLANAKAARVAKAGSDLVSDALKKEALTAAQATRAHRLLAAARAARPAVGAGRAGRAAPRGALGASSIIAGGGVGQAVTLEGTGALIDAIGQNTIVTRAQTRALAVIQSVGGKIGALFATIGARLGLPKLALELTIVGKAAYGLLAPLAGLAAAFTAAAGGVAFAGTSAYQMAKEMQTAGFMGGAAIGSYTDTIASAEVRTLSWIGTTTGAFDLIGDAATREAERRTSLFDEEAARRRAHMDQIEAIELNAARKVAEINRQAAARTLDSQLKSETDDAKRAELITSSIESLKQQLAVAERPSQRIDRLNSEASTLKGKLEFELQMIDQSEVNEARKSLAEAYKSGNREAYAEATKELEEAQAKITEILEGGPYKSIKGRLDEVRKSSQEEAKNSLREQISLIDRIIVGYGRQQDELDRTHEKAKEARLEEARDSAKALTDRQREINKVRERVNAELEGIQEIIDARRKAAADAIKTAQQQFVELERGERARLNSLTERLLAGGKVENQREVELLMKVDTPENKKAIEEFFARQAKELGFFDNVGRGLKARADALQNRPEDLLAGEKDKEFLKRQKDRDEQLAEANRLKTDQKAAAQNYADKFSVDREELGKRLSNLGDPGMNVEVFDKREIIVKMEEANAEKNARLAKEAQDLFEKMRKLEVEAEKRIVEEAYRKSREDEKVRQLSGRSAAR
jgi:uncharacterized protein YmfQ (DUF2313 family)